MLYSESAILGKWGFLLDIVQLVAGSTIAFVILGVVITLFVVVYIAGKVMNRQETRQGADNPHERGTEPHKVELKKN